jgi:hypothetical protein
MVNEERKEHYEKDIVVEALKIALDTSVLFLIDSLKIVFK